MLILLFNVSGFYHIHLVQVGPFCFYKSPQTAVLSKMKYAFAFVTDPVLSTQAPLFDPLFSGVLQIKYNNNKLRYKTFSN